MANFAAYAARSVETGFLPPLLMTCAGRFMSAVCYKYGAVAEVLAYKLESSYDCTGVYVETDY